MYINVSSQHVCVHRFITFLHIFMHILYMCRYACTCIVKYAFSVYVLCIHVCICISTLKCMYTCSMIMHVCMYCHVRCIPILLMHVCMHSISMYVCIEV